MKTIPFFSLLILLFAPALLSAQSKAEQSGQDLLGLTDSPLQVESDIYDEMNIREVLEAKEDVKALRIDILSVKPSLDDAERLELFDLQTAELQAALKQYLDERLEYPTEMKEYQIEGTVIVECVFTQDGKLLSPKIFKGLHPSCDKASLQALQGFEYDRAAYRGAKRIHVPLAFILE